jgi:hypothetical protein
MKSIICFILLATMVFAQETTMTKPDMATTKSVMDFYLNGNEAVLYEVKLTSAVENNEATDEITSIAKGEKVSVWMAFMIPKETVDSNYTVAIINGQEEIKSKVFAFETQQYGSLRYRTYTTKTLYQAGSYDIIIKNKDVEVYRAKVEVTE